MKRTHLFVLTSGILFAAVVGVFGSTTASAVEEWYCRGLYGPISAINQQRCINARNFGEVYSSYDICSDYSAASICGAFWAGYPGTNYFSDYIPDIDPNQNSVDLELRGSASPGPRSQRGYIYAKNIHIEANGRRVANNLWLYRGDTGSTGNYTWTTDQANYPNQSVRRFKLDISSIPPGGVKTFHIRMYRRFAFYKRETYSRCVSLYGWFDARVCPSDSDGSAAWQDFYVTIKKKPGLWTIDGQSYVTKDDGATWHQGSNALVAKPGDIISWWHGLKNTTADMSEGVETGVEQEKRWFNDSQIGGSYFYRTDRVKSRGTNNNKWFFMRDKTNGDMFTHRVTQDDLGKKICQRVYWRKEAWNRPNWGYAQSGYACANVLYDYNLIPSVGVDSEKIDEDTKEVSGIRASVRNSGPTKTDANTKKYAVARYVIKAEYSHVGVPSSGDGVGRPVNNGNDVCAIVQSIAGGKFNPSSCKSLSLSSNNAQLASGAMIEFLRSTSDDVSDLALQSGDKVCYVSMVSSYNRTVGENTFRYSNSKCVFVSKKPKVQIWGGDAKTNKEAITSITVQKNTRLETEHVIDASVLQSSGLWKTGIDSNNNTLKDDSKDPHWSIICSQDYKGGSGNQKAYNQSNNPAWLPACKGDASGLKTEYQARVIMQRGNMVGNYTCPWSPPPARYIDILGDVPTSEDSDGLCQLGPWTRTSGSAKWIGLNIYGQHTNVSKRPDLSSNYDLAGDKVLDYGNMYVFRLKNIKLGNLKDAKNLTLKFSGAVDNLIRVKINGYEMDVNAKACQTCSYVKYKNTPWAMPGLNKYSQFNAGMKPGTVLKSEGNVIDFYIKSDWTHMGLLIDNIAMTYTMDRTYQSTYGSWGEYGIAAKDKVASSSGAGLSSGYAGRDGVSVAGYNKLTFANTPTFGNFTKNPLVLGGFTTPSVRGNRGRISGLVDVNSLSTGEYMAGNVTLSGTTLSTGKSVVIRSSGTVKISGNLLYEATSDTTRLPQLIIYAENIIIEPDVSEVNAWLITRDKGYVSTCGSVVNMTSWLSGLSSSQCDKQLRVNGPIMAGSLFLRRTYGGRHSSPARNDDNMHPGTPAEILNLRADAYIWAYNNYRGSGAIRTMNVKELPPRY
ncbi:hypothetical protein EUA75_02510 [TM7 phylum sp. oral taxon 353]|nr:hypothetical protein EUA75_02510 [TM7 phylum sp. oral taxon 353]